MGLVDEVRGQRICIDTAPIIYFIEHHVKYRSIIRDELVKSHIPYVVHASTKPVLSEPSTLRLSKGRTVHSGQACRRVMLTFYETIKY